jgi:hypothetical protein
MLSTRRRNQAIRTGLKRQHIEAVLAVLGARIYSDRSFRAHLSETRKKAAAHFAFLCVVGERNGLRRKPRLVGGAEPRNTRPPVQEICDRFQFADVVPNVKLNYCLPLS